MAELAYLYLQLTKLELAGLVDDQKKGKNFFGVVIKGTESLHEMEWDLVMVTRLDDPEEDYFLLAPLFARPSSWRVLDLGIALVMASLAASLLGRFFLG